MAAAAQQLGLGAGRGRGQEEDGGEARGAAEDVPGQSCERLIGEVVQSRRISRLLIPCGQCPFSIVS